MDPTTLTEHGCTWVRTSIPDGGAGSELVLLRDEFVGDEDWQGRCDLLMATYEDVLYDQAPCAAWHPATGLITACVRHIDRIDPRAAWLIAHARMADGTPEVTP